MDALKLPELRRNEEGYLLLENLVTLMVILTILVITYPLIVDWLILREHAQQDVELSRVLYESSVNWPAKGQDDRGYIIKTSNNLLVVEHNHRSMEVEIHAVKFEK